MDLPYSAEYATSSRVSCKGCKLAINRKTLRLAAMVQSPGLKAKVPHWYHQHCFFTKYHSETVDDIAHFKTLRFADQKALKAEMELRASGGVSTRKRKKKGDKAAAENTIKSSQFAIEYCKSRRVVCRECKTKLMKSEVGVTRRDSATDLRKRSDREDISYHLTCFVKLRLKLSYFETGEKLPGFKSLSKHSQKEVKAQLPAIDQEGIPKKKSKLDKDETDYATLGNRVKRQPRKRTGGQENKVVDKKDNKDIIDAEEEKPHIKKPLNAFMLYMKEERAKVIAECTLTESAAINKLLGKRWHSLSPEEKSKFHEKALQERELHIQLHPDWPSPANISLEKKGKRKKDSANAVNIVKKCRVRYGVDRKSQWCSPCRGKKKCIRFLESGDGNDENQSDGNDENQSDGNDENQSDGNDENQSDDNGGNCEDEES